MSFLFSPSKIKSIEFKNRIFVSPMCQYSAENGVPNDWHMVHLGSRAVGGAALVIVEATGVNPEGRISANDLGLWNDDQLNSFKRITHFIKEQGSVAGIQLAHAGRKASTLAPWIKSSDTTSEQNYWKPMGPSALAFDEKSQVPLEMNLELMQKVLNDFVLSTKRGLAAGFEVLEIHMAHGYLLNEFLSPISNQRKDQYGGSLENRMRYPLDVTKAIRAAWPDHLPLFVRISASDWVDGGWTLEDSLVLTKELKKLGVDLIDCSSGGSSPHAKITAKPGYQVPFAESIRKNSQILTGAVGLITEPEQAEEIIKNQQADYVLLAREFLRNPYWPMLAAKKLNVDFHGPKQYGRSKT